ncbi:MAG TPA: FAD-binding oxidoreductase [Capsulimonadaceae bacterium]|nr:FAD-binding oxidoreductase [Capsulimonadaceae bacterium]
MADYPQSVEEVQDRVRQAAMSYSSLAPQGGGTQLHIGFPPSRPVVPLPLTKLDALVEYTPEDLVVIAQAGMTLGRLQAILAEKNQWLPLEIARPDQQTLGGIVASRANSILRGGYGSVRDWLIGLDAVGADGEIVKGGGKVVKNVSGYDLPKLYCGSWGTLGVVTQVAFKVAARPDAACTLLAVLGADRNSEEALDTLLGVLTPAFTLLFNAEAAREILGDDAAPAQYLALRFSGVREAVEESAHRAVDILSPYSASVLALSPEVGEKLGKALRDFPLADAPLAARHNVLSSQVGAFVRMIDWTAEKAGLKSRVMADALTGVVYAQYHPNDPGAFDWNSAYPAIKDKADRVGGSFVIERMPDPWRESGIPVWSPELPDWKLMEQIKKAFDPKGIFNPGRFVVGA